MSDTTDVDHIKREAHNAAINAAMDAIQREREKAACDFTDPKCKGQRGQDRTDTFYDAYQVVRALLQ